jgi:hypothetical protein
LERLKIITHRLYWQDDVQNTQWLEFLRPFSSVKDLALFGDSDELIASALRERTGEGAMDILPALQNLFFRAPWPSKSVREIIKRFIAARRRSGRPVILRYWVDRREGRRGGVTGGEWMVLGDGINALSAPCFPAR